MVASGEMLAGVLRSSLATIGDALAEAGQDLAGGAGELVGAGRALPGGAGGRAALGGKAAQLLAQRGGRGDQDRGQCGAGGAGCLDRVVAADEQQPQRLAGPVGAHLRRVRAARTASIASLLPARRLPRQWPPSISATCSPAAAK